nr:pantoate--beta-alanine ligase [Spirochaetota bacterium]
MIVVHRIEELRNILSKERKEKKTIGFVPTMGALHEGHFSLIKKSVSENNFTVVSIFVNPIQFGPNEDYEKYPRTLPEDTLLCEKGKADLIFAPDKDEMFGEKNYAFVDINELQDNLCGFSRPGHFRGVCTIVAKFFNIVNPDR